MCVFELVQMCDDVLPVSPTREQSMASVGYCVVSTAKRGYPLEDATHIAFSELHTHNHTATH